MAHQAAENLKEKNLNGVDVTRLFGTIDAIKEAPVIAEFKFRANNKWINGGHNHTTIKDFFGAQKGRCGLWKPMAMKNGLSPFLYSLSFFRAYSVL